MALVEQDVMALVEQDVNHKRSANDFFYTWFTQLQIQLWMQEW